MHLRRLLPILVFILAVPIFGYGQEKVVKSDDKKKTEQAKTVPMTSKTMEAIRLQNKKATMEQMHIINKAIRKSMTIHQRR